MKTVPPGVTQSKLRIAILMLNSPNIPNYAHFATMNNYMYAAKHGDDFIVERLQQNVEESWSWEPHPNAQKQTKGGQVWDIFYNQFSVSLDEILAIIAE